MVGGYPKANNTPELEIPPEDVIPYNVLPDIAKHVVGQEPSLPRKYLSTV
jgi:hypothetical protein